MITYRENTVIVVSLDNRIVGEIRRVLGGYQFFPENANKGGEVFVSLKQVKRSLEER